MFDVFDECIVMPLNVLNPQNFYVPSQLARANVRKARAARRRTFPGSIDRDERKVRTRRCVITMAMTIADRRPRGAGTPVIQRSTLSCNRRRIARATTLIPFS